MIENLYNQELRKATEIRDQILEQTGWMRRLLACTYRVLVISGDISRQKISERTKTAWKPEFTPLRDNYDAMRLVHMYYPNFMPDDFMVGTEVFMAEFTQRYIDAGNMHMYGGIDFNRKFEFKFTEDYETTKTEPTTNEDHEMERIKQEWAREKRERLEARRIHFEQKAEEERQAKLLLEMEEAEFPIPNEVEVLKMLDDYEDGFTLKHNGKHMLPVFFILGTEERFVEVIEANGEMRVILSEDVEEHYPITDFYQVNADGYTRRYFSHYIHLQKSLPLTHVLKTEDIPKVMSEPEITRVADISKEGHLVQDETLYEVGNVDNLACIDRTGTVDFYDGKLFPSYVVYKQYGKDQLGYSYTAPRGHIPGYVPNGTRQLLRHKRKDLQGLETSTQRSRALTEYVSELQEDMQMTALQAKGYLSSLVDLTFQNQEGPPEFDQHSALYMGKLIEREFALLGITRVGKNLERYSRASMHTPEQTQLLKDLWSNRNYSSHYSTQILWVDIDYGGILANDLLCLSSLTLLERLIPFLQVPLTLRSLFKAYSSSFAVEVLTFKNFQKVVETYVKLGDIQVMGRYYYVDIG